MLFLSIIKYKARMRTCTWIFVRSYKIGFITYLVMSDFKINEECARNSHIFAQLTAVEVVTFPLLYSSVCCMTRLKCRSDSNALAMLMFTRIIV